MLPVHFVNAHKLPGCKSKMLYPIPKQICRTLALHPGGRRPWCVKPGCLTSKGRTASASGLATTLVLGAAIKLFNFKEECF